MDRDKALDKLSTIKETLEADKQKKQRLEGKREAKVETLKKIGFKSLKEAKDGLKKIGDQIGVLDEELDALLEEFVKEFPQLLEEEDGV